MESTLARIAEAARRRRRTVVLAWGLLLLGTAWFALHQSDRLSGGGWDVPGSEAQRAADVLEGFPAFDGVRFAVLVEAGDPERAEAAASAARVKLRRFDDLRPGGEPRLLDGGRAVLIPLLWNARGSESAFDFAGRLRRALVSDDAGASTRVIGEPAIWSNFQEVSKEQLRTAESSGVPRIHGGLHYRFDMEAGARMGRHVSSYILRNELRPLHGQE